MTRDASGKAKLGEVLARLLARHGRDVRNGLVDS